MKKLLLALALLLPLTGCQTAAGPSPAPSAPTQAPAVSATPSPTPTPTPTPEPTLSAEPTIWGEQTMRTTFVDEQGDVYFDMAFSFPYAAAPEYEAVNDYFAALLRDYADEARGHAEEIKAGGHYPFYGNDLYLYANTRSIYESNRFLTFTLSRNCWLGGPHPNYEIFYANLDLTTGKALTLPGLFTDWPAARTLILENIKAQIPEQYEYHLNGNPSPVDVDYEKMGAAADRYLDNTPFLLTDEGVEFCFNKGAIADPADTPYWFTVPYGPLSEVWALGETPAFNQEAQYEELFPTLPAEPTIWGEQAVRADYLDETGNPHFKVDISLPYIGSLSQAHQAINTFYSEKLPVLKAQAEEQLLLTWGHLSISYEVSVERGRYLCFRLYENSYYGGAHDNRPTAADTFDLATGKRLALDKLFTDWPMAQRRIIGEISAQINALDQASEADWSFILEAAQTQFNANRFYLTNEGIIIFYNEYEIAAYSAGSFEFLIPYSLLEALFIYD